MSSQPGQSGPPPGPPYLPQVAQLGGIPSIIPDVPISVLLLALFIGGAVTHMTVFQVNRRRERKFVFSALLFGFCMARITALTMRIVWATHQTNINVAIAANVFTAAGVLLLFVVNLLFAQRIVRAYHPSFGWHRTVSWVFRGVVASIVALLIMLVITSVHSFFTLDPGARQKERNVQLFAGTYLATLAFLPTPIVITAALLPRDNQVEKFGTGRLRTKLALLLTTSFLLSLGAGFRIGVNFAPRSLHNPAWYHSKACYYCFNFVIELIVVYLYAGARFDKRFHVPNGADGPGKYRGVTVNTENETYGNAGAQNQQTPASGEAASGERTSSATTAVEGQQNSGNPMGAVGSGRLAEIPKGSEPPSTHNQILAPTNKDGVKTVV
ncbi:hypothetical protein B0H66DRAFT_562606 [Apodospora peruviana]|uniref:Family c-likeg-protein-coupled receptor protein n=1 Tax=Apodospora peruviana TaxID=516989 RepID=A0AAE0I1V0_9PEZI|nr:hypothetical protein B0H66DRAFT_562606 [Apodospora peruviana]